MLTLPKNFHPTDVPLHPESINTPRITNSNKKCASTKYYI